MRKPTNVNANRSSETAAATLRIIQITDVYTLINFPHLRNLINDKRNELNEARGGKNSGSKTISMLTGDFFMPYLLSQVDGGMGMMSMINAVPIDYLTFGNHEADLPHSQFMEREQEYKGTWINTNMQSHESFHSSSCQTDAAIVEVRSADGTNIRRVGLIALLTNAASLYKPSSFNGATINDPWDTMSTYKQKLESLTGEDKVDLVVPLCHLYEAQDERTSREFDFPVILSGHDHHVVDRVVNGTRILKPGLDGHFAVVLDITWDYGEATSSSSLIAPKIEAEVLRVADYPPDPSLVKLASAAYEPLRYMRETEVTKVPSRFRPLSSENARGTKITMGSFLCTALRDALNLQHSLSSENDILANDSPSLSPPPPHVHAVMLKGGNLRGGNDYGFDSPFTLETLMEEHNPHNVHVVEVPGSVLRGGLRETWTLGRPHSGYFQHDEGVVLDEDGFITSIAGEQLHDDMLYRIGTMEDFWRARDGPSIGAYFVQNTSALPSYDLEQGGWLVYSLLLSLFAERIWQFLWRKMDANGDGKLSQAEFSGLDMNGSSDLDREDVLHALQYEADLATTKKEYTFVDCVLRAAAGFGLPPSVINTTEPVSLEQLNTIQGKKMDKWDGPFVSFLDSHDSGIVDENVGFLNDVDCVGQGCGIGLN